MHGVSLTLEADYPALIDYASEHLRGLACAPSDNPDLLVRCFWTEGEWDPHTNPFPTNGSLSVIGKRMLGDPEQLIWLNTLRMKGLQLRFLPKNRPLTFEVAYRFHPKEEKLSSLPEYEYKRFFSLMSYLVYYPLMWYLEHHGGWTILHASALDSPHGGIIIGGLGGVGKTTTCVGLLQQPDIQLVAENIVFTDGRFVYPCYEPIRLDSKSLAILGKAPTGLTPMTFPAGLKKKGLFHVTASELPGKVKPAVLFLPQFSSRRYLTELKADVVGEKMVAVNRLTRELDDYGWYASALNMHWPVPGQASNRVEVMGRFAKRVRSFELGIDRSAGVQAVVEDILAMLE